MDRLTPLISKFHTHVVPLAQNTRAYFEPSFNRIHIPKNALVRNYLTLAATVGLISGIFLAIGRTFQYNLDQTGRKEYSFTAALKDIAGCTVFPGAGFVWRKMFGISKTVPLSALEHAAITAQTSNDPASWRSVGRSFTTATPEEIDRTQILLKGNRTNLDHLPVDMLALFFPQALSEWVSRSKSNSPIEWANLGQFDLALHREDVIRGFDFRAAADAAILVDNPLAEADPKKAQAKERLDDLALELEVLLGKLPESNEGVELRNLNAALKIVKKRRDLDQNHMNDRLERVYKEWFFTVDELKDLSKTHLEITDPAGETVLRLIAAKYPDVLLNYFQDNKVDHALHNPVGKPTLLAIALANADLSKDQTGLINAILSGVPGVEDNKHSVYIELSLPDILANLQDRIIAGRRKDLSTTPTKDELKLAEQAAKLLEVLRNRQTVNSIEAKQIDLTNFSHLKAATLEYKLTQGSDPDLLEQCRAFPNAPWLAFEAQRISSSDPAYVFYVLENKFQKSLENPDAGKGLSDEGLRAYRAKKERRFARQADQELIKLGKNAEDLDGFTNLQTAMVALTNYRTDFNKKVEAFFKADEPTDLPPLENMADLDSESMNRLPDLINKGAWQNKDAKAAFVKAFATNTEWNLAIEENVPLVRTKFAACRNELKLLDSNPHRSAYLLDTKYQAAIKIEDQASDAAKKAWKELVDFIKISPAEVCKDLPDNFVTHMPVDQVASLFASGRHADAILTNKKDAIVTASKNKDQLEKYDPVQQRVISSALDFMLPKAKGKLSPDQAKGIFIKVVRHTPAERGVLTTRLRQTLEGLGTKGSTEVRELVLDQGSDLLQLWESRYINSNDTVQQNAIAGTMADILKLLRDYSELDLPSAETVCPRLAQVWLNWNRTPQELINEGNWNQLFPVLSRITNKKERDAAIRNMELPERFDDKATMSPEAFVQLFGMGVFKGKTLHDGKHNITNTIVNSPHLLGSDAVIAALTAPANQPLWVQGTSAIQQLAASNEWKRLSVILGRLDKKTLTTAAASIPLPNVLNMTCKVLSQLLAKGVFKDKRTADGRNIVSLIIEQLNKKQFVMDGDLWTYLSDDAQIPLYLETGGAENSRRSPIQSLFEHGENIEVLARILLKMSPIQLETAAAAIREISDKMEPNIIQNYNNRLFGQYQNDIYQLSAENSVKIENDIKAILIALSIPHTAIDETEYPLVYKLLAPSAPE